MTIYREKHQKTLKNRSRNNENKRNDDLFHLKRPALADRKFHQNSKQIFENNFDLNDISVSSVEMSKNVSTSISEHDCD